MIKFFKLLLMKLRRLNSPTIEQPVSWSVEDFNKAKKWAQSRPHPSHKDKSIWEVVYNVRYDTAEVLHEINKFIIIENKKQIN